MTTTTTTNKHVSYYKHIRRFMAYTVVMNTKTTNNAI